MSDAPDCKDCGDTLEYEGPAGYGARCTSCTLAKIVEARTEARPHE